MATMTYYYCNGTTLEDVDVTLTFGGCIYDNFSTGDICNYRQFKREYTLSLSHAVPIDLWIRYTYHYYLEHNSRFEGEGDTYGYLIIPAGQTYIQDKVLCQEERWCTTNQDNGGAPGGRITIPQQV